MALTGLMRIVEPAAAAGRGAGAFNVISIEHAEAIAAGAESAGLPVILQISENCVRFHHGLAAIAAATLSIARSASVPVAVHLDHATDEELVRTAADLGLGSVMYDTSAMPYQVSVSATKALAGWCHDRGVAVEAELGEIGGKDGVHSPVARTRPAEAAAFARETGVDALAVAVGSSHAMLTRDAVLDLELIAEIHEVVPVPLVLHGSSGVPDETLSAAVAAGLAKVNIGTQLNKVFTAAVRETLSRNPAMIDPRRYLADGRDAVGAEVSRLLRIIT
jgi:fructose-bisphosphate aldolase, class II